MAVSLTLYRVNCDPNTVDKTPHITESKPITGTVRGEFNVQNFAVECAGDMSRYNYAEFNGRYYRIDNCNRIRTGISMLTMSTDVLWTYKDAIYLLPAVVDRSYRMVNAYLPDSMQKVRQYTQCVNKPIGTDPNDGMTFHYSSTGHVIMTVG